MHLMVELDGGCVARSGAKEREFRMSIVETLDIRRHFQRTGLGLQIAVALRAACIADARERGFSVVLHMATGAFGCECLLHLMNGTVVTGLAGLIGHLGR